METLTSEELLRLGFQCCFSSHRWDLHTWDLILFTLMIKFSNVPRRSDGISSHYARCFYFDAPDSQFEGGWFCTELLYKQNCEMYSWNAEQHYYTELLTVLLHNRIVSHRLGKEHIPELLANLKMFLQTDIRFCCHQ